MLGSTMKFSILVVQRVGGSLDALDLHVLLGRAELAYPSDSAKTIWS